MSRLHTPPVVGLHGFAQSGKDTVADILKDYGYQRLAFADKMRDALYALNPFIQDPAGQVFSVRLRELVDTIGWDRAKVEFAEVRRLLQVFGTEVGRDMFGQNFWVDQVIKQIEPNQRYVITDVRFPNELDALGSHFGGDVMLVKIKRPGVGPVNGHVSDAGLSDLHFDRIIENDGTLVDLRDNVEVLLGLL